MDMAKLSRLLLSLLPVICWPLLRSTDDWKTTLHLAAEGVHSKILEALLAHRRSFPVDAATNQGIVPLHIAARAGHVNDMIVLIRHIAQKDFVDGHSKTALLLAAENGHLSYVEQLLEQGADYKKTDDSGRTALHLAAINGHMAVAKTLSAFKDIMWTQDECHHTAFDLLVRHEKIKYVEDFIQMLDNTVSNETESNRGGIPLHVAANMGNIDMLRLLLDKGWRPDVRDAERFAPKGSRRCMLQSWTPFFQASSYFLNTRSAISPPRIVLVER